MIKYFKSIQSPILNNRLTQRELQCSICVSLFPLQHVNNEEPMIEIVELAILHTAMFCLLRMRG